MYLSLDVVGGAEFHKDYYDTSFYNACIRGSKHWILIPRIPPPLPFPFLLHYNILLFMFLFRRVRGYNRSEGDRSVDRNAHPRLVRANLPQTLRIGSSLPLFRSLCPSRFLFTYFHVGIKWMECNQEEGDLLYVPFGGTWHVTLNYERSISVSSNFIYLGILNFI